ncbi:MAG TPA: hypothetical protein VFB45_25250 [Pseudolabrys sp.]|nr:hypothetical protein [Pseudolabrys sp.]
MRAARVIVDRKQVVVGAAFLLWAALTVVAHVCGDFVVNAAALTVQDIQALYPVD